MRALALIPALVVLLACGEVAAQDSLSVQTFALGSEVQRALASFPDSISAGARDLLLRALDPLTIACRSTAMSKQEEPGKAFLSWRTLRHVSSDSSSWFFGALSCTDTLCGALVPHDRFAALRVQRRGATLSLFPGESSTIGDQHATRVDSVLVFRGPDNRLIQAWRKVTSDHPCWGGPDHYSAESTLLFVLQDDRITHAFQILAHADTVSGDAVDGDTGTSVRSFLQMSASSIEVRTRTEQWANTPAGQADSTRTKMRQSVLELELDPKTGRFVRTP